MYTVHAPPSKCHDSKLEIEVLSTWFFPFCSNKCCINQRKLIKLASDFFHPTNEPTRREKGAKKGREEQTISSLKNEGGLVGFIISVAHEAKQHSVGPPEKMEGSHP